MDWHAVVGFLIFPLQVYLISLYIKEMIYGTTRPNIVSWSLWTCATAILLVAQLSAGASWSLLLPIALTGLEFAVVIVGFAGYGYKKFGIAEGVCLVLSLGALGLWYVTSNPVIAILCIIAADLTAYVPTIIKTYREPHTEPPLPWFLSSCVGALGVASTSVFNLANATFPVYYLLINLVVWGLSLPGHKAKKA